MKVKVLSYLIGCICAYFIFRFDMRKDDAKMGLEYSVSDRYFCIALSSFSWAGVVDGGIIYIIGLPPNDTKAKW